MSTASPSRGVIRRGLRLTGRFIRWHPVSFTLAVLGSFVYVGSLVAAARVIGWVTDEVVGPYKGEPGTGGW